MKETNLKKATHYELPTVCHSTKGKTIEILKKMSGFQGLEGGKNGESAEDF